MIRSAKAVTVTASSSLRNAPCPPACACPCAVVAGTFGRVVLLVGLRERVGHEPRPRDGARPHRRADQKCTARFLMLLHVVASLRFELVLFLTGRMRRADSASNRSASRTDLSSGCADANRLAPGAPLIPRRSGLCRQSQGNAAISPRGPAWLH